jgi:predicted dehydrogenase
MNEYLCKRRLEQIYEKERVMPRKRSDQKIRYAVVGLGYIAQVAVLPAFQHASRNSELSALISDDPQKLRELSEKYDVKISGNYEDYENILRSGNIDAVYIALPNHMHREYTVRAAEAGIHVLCEKPMAVTIDECREMIDACEKANVKLMIAYRLHFDKANLSAVEIVQSEKIGIPKMFNSTFSMHVKEGNIRLNDESLGGGPVYDIGIYCINAARYLFRSEPEEVFAFSATSDEERFNKADEMTAVTLKFSDAKLASFVCSFGAADTSNYRVIGTEGDLRVEPAYEYAEPLIHYLTVEGKTSKKSFKKRDQFAPELEYFSDCILSNETPEPGGNEGLIDIQIIQAVLESAKTGRPVSLAPIQKRQRPEPEQEIEKPAVDEPELVHAESPGRE